MTETLHEMAVRMVKGEDCQPQCGKGCDKCPAGKLRSTNGVCLVRGIAKVDNCEEQIEGLRAWAEEHPVPRYPTWREWHTTTFPNVRRFFVCPGQFGDDDKNACGNYHCGECVNRPIPADIAEKLGIRPKKPDEPLAQEEKGCSDCRYDNRAEEEEPCMRCRRAKAFGGDAWKSMPDLWKPRDRTEG